MASLAYRDEGDGLPVLALSGLTRNGTDFDYLAPHLRGVRLIRAGLRGRGASDWTGAATYTVPQEGKDAHGAAAGPSGDQKVSGAGHLARQVDRHAAGRRRWDRLLGLCLNDVGPALGTRRP